MAKFEGKNQTEWAKHYGISRNAISKRMKRFGSPHPNPKPKVLGSKRIVIEGKTLIEWATHYNITYTQVFNRLKRNGSVHIECNGKPGRKRKG